MAKSGPLGRAIVVVIAAVIVGSLVVVVRNFSNAIAPARLRTP